MNSTRVRLKYELSLNLRSGSSLAGKLQWENKGEEGARESKENEVERLDEFSELVI